VVPTRVRVILYAGETTLSGRMGINATFKKLCSNFFAPATNNVDVVVRTM
jgi:hypothetical protein